jgi:hypothetical protein
LKYPSRDTLGLGLLAFFLILKKPPRPPLIEVRSVSFGMDIEKEKPESLPDESLDLLVCVVDEDNVRLTDKALGT